MEVKGEISPDGPTSLISGEIFLELCVCLYQKVNQVSIVIPTSDGVQSHNDQSNYNLVVVEANVMFHFSWLLLHEP